MKNTQKMKETDIESKVSWYRRNIHEIKVSSTSCF